MKHAHNSSHSVLIMNLIKLKGTAKLTVQDKQVCLKDSKYILLEILANTVSAPIQPRGSIFQNGFLDGVQFKVGSQKVRFYQNSSIFTILEHTRISKMHYSA